MKKTNSLTQEQSQELLSTLQERYEKNVAWFKGIKWEDVQAKLEANPDKLNAINKMEETGGEPALIGYDKKAGEYIFCDCSKESPAGRRSLCYDKEALDARKANKPSGSALEQAAEMGIKLLNEEEYREFQKLGEFDLKTSSWIETPAEVRKLGGALFCDRRYGRVFTYHNGAESYYAARGFRGKVKV